LDLWKRWGEGGGGSESHQNGVPIYTLLPSLAGEVVSVVGFGIFGQACGPSVTSGILSAVVQVDDTPVMLQTTCAVHSGSSGGPIFSTHSGDLLGNQLHGPPNFSLAKPQSHQQILCGQPGRTLCLGMWWILCPYLLSQGFQAVLPLKV
jgi:hypothetical protein